MKKKLFDKRLYFEAIKGLRSVGISLLVLAILGCVIPVFTRGSSGNEFAFGTHSALVRTSAAMFAPALIGYTFLGSAILVFYAFRFLFSRPASDYYHSLPHSRLSLYISIVAAVLTWAVATVIICVMASWLSYGMTGLPFNGGYVPYILAFYLACTIIVAGASLIGVSLTGRWLPAVTVTGLVLFLPRTVTVIFTRGVQILAPIAAIRDLGILTNPAYHLPTALIWRVLGIVPIGMSAAELFLFTGGIIYTVIVGLAYLTLGGFVFARRKSEIAGMSAPNKVCQHVFRCGAALLFLMPVAYYSFTQFDRTAIRYVNMSNMSVMIIFFAASVAIYFLYELITTKSAKNMIKVIPYYLVTAAVAVAVTFGAMAYGKSVFHTVPEPDDVDYISIYSEDIFIINEKMYPEQPYADIAVESVHFTNYEMKVLLFNSLLNDINNKEQNGYTKKVYAFHFDNGMTLTRSIKLSDEEVNRLFELQLGNQEYKNLYRSLPDIDDIDRITVPGGGGIDGITIWPLLKEELALISDQDYFSSTYSNTRDMIPYFDRMSRIVSYGGLYIKGELDGCNFSNSYSLTDKTPLAAIAYMKSINQDNYETAQRYFGQILNADVESYAYDINLTWKNADLEGIIPTYFEYNSSRIDYVNQSPYTTPSPMPVDSRPVMSTGVIDEGTDTGNMNVIEMIYSSLSDEITFDKPLLFVDFQFRIDDTYENVNFYINVTDEQLREIAGIKFNE